MRLRHCLLGEASCHKGIALHARGYRYRWARSRRYIYEDKLPAASFTLPLLRSSSHHAASAQAGISTFPRPAGYPFLARSQRTASSRCYSRQRPLYCGVLAFTTIPAWPMHLTEPPHDRGCCSITPTYSPSIPHELRSTQYRLAVPVAFTLS